MTDHRNPEMVFNLDLAVGDVSSRFCSEAASVLGLPLSMNDPEQAFSDEEECDAEMLDEIVHYWDALLSEAGYYVRWDAGDVAVFNLNTLSQKALDRFYEEVQS